MTSLCWHYVRSVLKFRSHDHSWAQTPFGLNCKPFSLWEDNIIATAVLTIIFTSVKEYNWRLWWLCTKGWRCEPLHIWCSSVRMTCGRKAFLPYFSLKSLTFLSIFMRFDWLFYSCSFGPCDHWRWSLNALQKCSKYTVLPLAFHAHENDRNDGQPRPAVNLT